MALKTFETHSFPAVVAEPLTPKAFAPYGGVISADHQMADVKSSSANYGTATKLHRVAPIVNNFSKCKSGTPESPRWNVFRCSAPKHLIQHADGQCKRYKAKVLERHPYSTQTFVPMGQPLNKDSFVVIVATTDPSSSDKLPDPASVKAFVCKGNQSVTYGAGTWHAPMVVIDEGIAHIDFAVFIYENGVADEDCQECYFEPGYSVVYPTDEQKSKL